jgi:hypothetical protein
MPDHPALAFASGVASHFAIDAIPHWDYPLRAISVKPNTGIALRLNWPLFQDLGLILLDACVGLAIALWLYATPTGAISVLLGALGAMLPDPLQFAYRLYPREPLRTLQQFHVWIHTKRKLTWPIGASSQLSFIVLVVLIFAAMRAVGSTSTTTQLRLPLSRIADIGALACRRLHQSSNSLSTCIVTRIDHLSSNSRTTASGSARPDRSNLDPVGIWRGFRCYDIAVFGKAELALHVLNNAR